MLWQKDSHAKQIETNDFLDEKFAYIHNNPVEGGFVSRAEDYIYSSARNYCGEVAIKQVVLL